MVLVWDVVNAMFGLIIKKTVEKVSLKFKSKFKVILSGVAPTLRSYNAESAQCDSKLYFEQISNVKNNTF